MYEFYTLLFFGAFVMIIIYNLGYLIVLRSAMYASYFMFHASLFTIMLFYTGIIEEAWFNVTINDVPIGVFFLCVIFFLAFSRDFLDLGALLPKFNGVINKIIILNSIFLVLFAFSLTNNFLENCVVGILIMEVLALLFLTGYLCIKGNIYARFYLWSFSFLLGTFVMASLSYFGIMRPGEHLPLLFEMSILFEASGLSFAMAYKQKELDIHLRQNELLFQELSHRVQNNLQQMISILTIQMGAIENAAIKAHLEDTIRRIGSIALIHKTLQNSSKPGKVNMNVYINSLVKGYHGLHPSANFHVACDQQIELEIDKLTPLALILNELITNSIKHGLKGIKDAHIHISLQENKEMHFTYGDNGPGYNAGSAGDSLGIKLIDLLSKSQLKGHMHVETVGKYCFTLNFSK
ncbi:MAG TPA: histidine kinase [Sulfuricurvum sp.]|nr:histidine kinase [Sulfuricurvum sp.]